MNIRERLDNSAEDNLYDLINSDYEKWLCRSYVGRVVDNNDPDKNGRCKIRVFGIFGNEIDDKNLPWAIPEFSFIGSKVGNFIVPDIGTNVRVYFDCGEIYLPIYTTKVIDTKNMPSQKDTDYPDNMVMFETDDGDFFTVNRKSKLTTYKHNSGVQITIDENGVTQLEHPSGTKYKINKLGNVTEELKPTANKTFKSNLTVVTPDSVKFGPYCALQFDTLTGLPLQGNIVTRVS